MNAFNGAGEPGGAPDLDDILAQMFGMGGGMGGMGGMPGGMGGMPGGMGGAGMPPKSDQQDYEVTLEDLYKGKTVKFASTKNVICSLCKGKGGKERATAKKCSTCDGQGFKEFLQVRGQFYTPQTAPCTTCNGRGSYFNTKDKCKRCKGKRVTEEKKVLEIYVPRGARGGEKIVLEGEADQEPDREPGDLVFRVVEKDHPVFQRAGADLAATIDVTLAEALAGFSRVVIKHLDGRGIELNYPKAKGGILTPGQVLKVRGEGMPIKRSDSHGDLYLTVNVKFPDEKWKPSAATLERFKEMLPKPDPPIKADTVDEVDYDGKASMDDFGAGDPHGGSWVDEDEDDEGGAQCTTQ